MNMAIQWISKHHLEGGAYCLLLTISSVARVKSNGHADLGHVLQSLPSEARSPASMGCATFAFLGALAWSKACWIILLTLVAQDDTLSEVLVRSVANPRVLLT